MRGKQAKKREIKPDKIYGSTTITKLINYIMVDGKKTVAETLVYDALEKLSENTKLKPTEALEKALNNIKPKVEVRSRRVGGANYQVPVPISEDRQLALAMRWITNIIREGRSGNKTSADTLYNELAAAFKNEGNAVKKKEDTHRMAEANKAFSHLSW